MESARSERGKLDYAVKHIVQALSMEVGVVRARADSNKVQVVLSPEVTKLLKANLSKYY